MENAPLMFSILFFLGCFVYSFFGIYMLHINSKAALNRIFFVLSLSLAVWALGFSVAVTAPDPQSFMFWRRVSAVGWGSVYAILLHYVLIMTERKAVEKRWVTALIYLPAAVSILVFSVLNLSPYVIVKTPFGWINAGGGTIWDWFFNVYYSGYALGSLWLLFSWGRKFGDSNKKKQSALIIATLFAALVLGTVFDIMGSSLFYAALPQIGPIIILIPVSGIFFAIKKYRLMTPKPESEDEIILTHKARTRIYNYVAAGFIAGAFLNFISQYVIFGGSLQFVLINSVILAAFGIIAYAVQRLRLARNTKNIISIAVVTAAIPVITLRFEQYSAVTVWVLPFVLLIIALTFNKRTFLVSVAASTLFTQIYLWLANPQQNVIVDGGHYIGRMSIFCVAVWVAVHVNKVYRMRIKENAAQIRFQKLVSEISTDFLNVTETELGSAIDDMIQKAGEFFEADKAYLCFYDIGTKKIAGSYFWFSDAVDGESKAAGGSPDAFPWIMRQINNQKAVHIKDSEELSPEAGEESALLQLYGVRSCIIIPIEYQGNVLGFIGVESCKGGKWNDSQIGLLKILANISAEALIKVDSEIRIKQMAYFDHLTGLPNRTLFMDRITQAINHAKRTNKMVGVIFLDLDDFKNVNDTMGHLGGDELLCKISQKLSDTVRKSDTVSRFGGDEFLIMLNDIKTIEDIVRITENIMTHFNKPFFLRGQEFFITASAGVTLYPIDGSDSEKLIKNADIAMYKAKEKGKNQYILCSSEMKEEVNKKMKLTGLLYHAIEKSELMLYYQPQVCLKTNKIIGLEALLRWKHPKLGMIYPNTFIPLAEQTGLINPIGEWVLRTACAQNKAWQDMGLPPVRMGVNTSVYQFRNAHFIDHVENILKETGLAAEDLELEITESMIMKESDMTVEVLRELKKLGIVISIDDFGTEYSSLSRLKMLPIDRIKMDMQFVHGIEKSDKDKAITKVIINLAQNLGVKVVAEGVETEKQLQFLSRRMCDEVQGFYCYRPAPADEVETMLRHSLLEDSAVEAGL